MTSIPEPPSHPPAPRRRMWWRTALIATAVVFALLVARFVLFFAGIVFEAERAETEAVQGLYALMAEEYRKDPAALEKTLPDEMREMARKNPTMTGVQIDERARITDLGTVLRVAGDMRGVIVSKDGTRRDMEMENRIYYYDRGMTYLVVLCFTGPSACGDRADLVERAEQALLSKLDGARLDGILPGGGACVPGQRTEAAHESRVTCQYPSRVSLSLERKNEEDTRRLIRSTFLSP